MFFKPVTGQLCRFFSSPENQCIWLGGFFVGIDICIETLCNPGILQQYRCADYSTGQKPFFFKQLCQCYDRTVKLVAHVVTYPVIYWQSPAQHRAVRGKRQGNLARGVFKKQAVFAESVDFGTDIH